MKAVIAAVPTPANAKGTPQKAPFPDHCRWALENGCDGVNALGPTGAANSFNTAARKQVRRWFAGTDNSVRTSREKIFGPCGSIVKVADFDETVAVANDTDFGLSAGLCVSSLKSARELKRRAQAGMLMVNLPAAGVDDHVPPGGRKGSCFGAREQGRYAVEFYATVKTSSMFAG